MNVTMSRNMKFRDSTKECLISLKDFLQKKEGKIKKQMQETQDLYLKEKDRGKVTFLELVLDKEKRKTFLREFRKKVENLGQMLVEWRGEEFNAGKNLQDENLANEDVKWNGILQFQKMKEELMRKLIKVKAKILEKEEQSLMISEEIVGGQLRMEDYLEEIRMKARRLEDMRKKYNIKEKENKNENGGRMEEYNINGKVNKAENISQDENEVIGEGLEAELEKAKTNENEIKRKIESLDGYLNRLKFDLDDKRNEKIEIFNELSDEKEEELNQEDSHIKLNELANIFSFSYVSQNFPQKIENLQFFLNLQAKVLKYLNSKGNEIEITMLRNEILDWFKKTNQNSEEIVFNLSVFFKQVEFDLNRREECFLIFNNKFENFKKKAEVCIEIFELSNTFESVSKQYFNFFLEKKKMNIHTGLLEDKILQKDLCAEFYKSEEANSDYDSEKEKLRKELDEINLKIENNYKVFEDELKRVDDCVLFDYITIYNKLKNKINELFNNELNYHLKLIEDSENDAKNDKKTQIYKVEILRLNKEIIGLFSFLLKNDAKPPETEKINELSKNDKLKLLENKIIILNSQLIEVKAMDYQEINKIEVKTHRFENLVQENQSQLTSIDNYINNIKKEENLTTTQLTEKSFIDEPQRRNSKRLNHFNREICKVFPPLQLQEEQHIEINMHNDENKENSNNLNTKQYFEGKEKAKNAHFQNFTQNKIMDDGNLNYFFGDRSLSKKRGSLAHNEPQNNFTNFLNLNHQSASNNILEKIYKKRRTQSFCANQAQNSSLLTIAGDKAEKVDKIERTKNNSVLSTGYMIKVDNIQKNGRNDDHSKNLNNSKNVNNAIIDNHSKNDNLSLMKEFEKSLTEKGIEIYKLQYDERDLNNSVFQARLLFLKKKEKRLDFYKIYENFGKKKSIIEGSINIDHASPIQIFYKKAMSFKNKEVLMINNDYRKKITIDKFLKLKWKGGMMELVGKNDFETIGLKKVLDSLLVSDSLRN